MACEPKTAHLAILVPDKLKAALAAAAARRFQTPSEFVRQSVVEKLHRDAAELNGDPRPAA